MKVHRLATQTVAILVATVSLNAGMWAQDYQFEDPVQLMAAGEVIDTGEHIAHSGPAFADMNHDGKMDLLVGNFRGTIEYFENIGSREAPEYAAGKMLEAEGEEIKIHNW